MKSQELWSSRIGFILSTMGSAIGLGSIWKFPYEVGSNGGGGFLLFYILGLIVVVAPLMLLEFAVGRSGRSDAVGSIAAVASASGAARSWQAVGALGILTSFLILSFYSVIGGWSLYYLIGTLRGGLLAGSAAAAQARFDAMLAAPWAMTGCHLAFIVMVALVVGRGIANGIETACKFLMPVLMVLIIILAVYSMTEGDIRSALRFLFAIHPASVSAHVALDALGLGFFSIGVGLAVMITYASYAAADVDLRQVAVATMLGDTAVSLLAGLAIFPIVFAEKLDPASGPGLMFVTLPLAFARLPFGTPAALAFFALLAIAALASAVSLLEIARGFPANAPVVVSAAGYRGCREHLRGIRPRFRILVQHLGELASARRNRIFEGNGVRSDRRPDFECAAADRRLGSCAVRRLGDGSATACEGTAPRSGRDGHAQIASPLRYPAGDCGDRLRGRPILERRDGWRISFRPQLTLYGSMKVGAPRSSSRWRSANRLHSFR